MEPVDTEIEKKVQIAMEGSRKRRAEDSERNSDLFEKLIQNDMPNLAKTELARIAAGGMPPSPPNSPSFPVIVPGPRRRITPIGLDPKIVQSEAEQEAFVTPPIDPSVVGEGVAIQIKKLPYVCELCGAGYHHRTSLSQHRRRNHSMEPHLHCRTCKKTFKPGRQGHLRLHESSCATRQLIKQLSE